MSMTLTIQRGMNTQYTLAKIENNLHQTSKRINVIGDVYETTVKGVNKLMQKVCRTHNLVIQL